MVVLSLIMIHCHTYHDADRDLLVQIEIPPLWKFERDYLGLKRDLVPVGLHKNVISLRRTYSM